MAHTINTAILGGAFSMLAIALSALAAMAFWRTFGGLATLRRDKGRMALAALCLLACVATIHGGGKSPVSPDKPDTPVTPDTPVEPDKPDTPVEPDNPDMPSVPRSLYGETAFAQVADRSAATVWNGVLWRKSGETRSAAGTIQVKVARERRGKAKVTATIAETGRRKLKVAGRVASFDNDASLTASDGRALVLSFGRDALGGSFGDDCEIEGMRNLALSKDASEKKAATADFDALKGVVNVSSPRGLFSFNVKARGKVAVSGVMAGGVKVGGCKAQLVMGEEGMWCAIPVSWAKKGEELSCVVWMRRDGTELAIEGLGDGCRADWKPESLPERLVFSLKGELEAANAEIKTSLLPTSFVFGGGSRWSFDKAGRVKLVSGEIVDTAESANPSGLKLSYAARTGAFKGSFKAYALMGGKLKKYSVAVSGLMVGDKGFGAAAIKRGGNSVPVEIVAE